MAGKGVSMANVERGSGSLGRRLILALGFCALSFAAVTASAGSAVYDPSADANSMAATTQYLGASGWWSAGYTGKGIDVAVIDSGVAPVAGLDDPGKVLYGPDLSLESQAPNLRHYDTYGHGTFMAGLIAGRDDANGYRGIAPDARIVSLKVATADGGSDVSQVIAAIDWVLQHAHDPGLNIRVINLSYGTNSTQPYGVDPLAHAVERAWKRGIVVVAASGNTGYQRGSGAPGLADPAYEPYVLAVGASDSMGTPSTKDDRVAPFSASSPGCGGCKNPDLVAPGSHLQGLRVGNSWIDARHPEGVIDARYFRGSGTSQAAAIVSGAVALVLQKYPTMSPDLVKRFLQSNAAKLASFDTQAQGAGLVRLGAMLTATPQWSFTGQHFTEATGGGSLERSRGTDHLSRDGVTLTGDRDIFGHAVDTQALADAEASASTWSTGDWNGSTWSGSTWSGSTWSASSWSASSWSGSTWSASTWSGSTWSGSTWSASTWSGSSWSGSTWSGGTWATAGWG
jgi:serine protease AprX